LRAHLAHVLVSFVKLTLKRLTNESQKAKFSAMANPPVTIRLRPVMIAYLDDLGRIGPYGKGRAGVIRRFVETGIRLAIERSVIQKRDGGDFGEDFADENEDA
jgi:hypothetical protein